MNIKKISAILLVALLAVSTFGCGDKKNDEKDDSLIKVNEILITDDGFTYGENGEGTYEITGLAFEGDPNTVKDPIKLKIPAKISEREVTGIAENAFKAIKTITDVEIPEGIEYIGDSAFYDCDGITAMVLPSTLVEIGVGAFRNCDKLESINLPTGMTKINDFTFWECTKLKGVVIPETVTVIGDGAFFGCASIEEITLPTKLTDLGACAFYGCTSLKKATVMSTELGVDDEVPIEGQEGKFEIIEHTIGEAAFGNCNPDEKTKVTMTEFVLPAESEFKNHINTPFFIICNHLTLPKLIFYFFCPRSFF